MFFLSASAYETSLQAPTPTIPPFSRYGTPPVEQTPDATPPYPLPPLTYPPLRLLADRHSAGFG